MGGGMQPDSVAKALANVMDDWQAQAHQCIESDDEACQQANRAFSSSCAKITNGIVQGSQGSAKDVEEYMNDICSWVGSSAGQSNCFMFGKTILGGMTADVFDNRENFPLRGRNTGKLCTNLWTTFVDGQEKLHEKEVTEEKAEEKKEAEAAAEEAKKEAAKAEALKKAEAEAEKQRKAKEEAEAKEAEKRLADAKIEVAKSMDQEKAKVKEVESKAEAKMKEAAAVEKDTVAATLPVTEPVEKKAEVAKPVEKKLEKAASVEEDTADTGVPAYPPPPPVSAPVEKKA